MKNIFYGLILFSLLNSFLIPQTYWQAIPSGTSASLQAVHFSDLSTGYIVGDAGAILKTTDAGLSWQNVSYSIPVMLYDVYAFNQDNVIAVGGGGLIIKTSDGGNTWNVIQSNVTEELYSVSFNGNVGICGGSSQTILYSTDSGTNWNTSQTGFFGGGFWGTYMLTQQLGFVAGENSIFQPLFGKSTDSGINWDFTSFYLNTNEGKATSIEFTDINTGIITASVWDGTGAISKTTDGGINWITTMFPSPVNDAHFPISNASLRGYAVGDAGTILLTWDAGSTWSNSISGTTERLNGVHFIDLELGIVVGDQGVILRTTDGGLPVELISFTGSVFNNIVTLNWITSTEINNAGFEIERFISDSWMTVGFVKGNGTSTETNYYTFNDKNVEPGIYYFRLKRRDFDGSFEYSNEIQIEVSAVQSFSLEQNYPNPFNPTTSIQYAIGSTQFVQLNVYDVLGNEIVTLVNEEKPSGTYEVEFSLESSIRHPASGIYFYQLKAGNYLETKKMILLK
jgi:photosystem II stability/assembly factor-like uncharacterized protein